MNELDALTQEERKAIRDYLDKNGYANLSMWAADSDYRLCPVKGWVNEDDNPVSIPHALLTAIESMEAD